MSRTIVVPGADFSPLNLGWVFPQSTDLVALNWLRVDNATAVKNVANTAFPSVATGTPTYTATSSVMGKTKHIKTAFKDDANGVTYAVLAQYRVNAVLFGNFNNTPTKAGVVMTWTGGNHVQLLNAAQIFIPVTVLPAGWNFIVGWLSEAEAKMGCYFPAAAASEEVAITVPRSRNVAVPGLWGTYVDIATDVDSDLAFGAMWKRKLTLAEATEVYTTVKSRAALAGLVVN